MQELGDNYAIHKRDVVESLLGWGYPQLADEALRDLPDPIDLNKLQEWMPRRGFSHDDLVSHLGAAPESVTPRGRLCMAMNMPAPLLFPKDQGSNHAAKPTPI